VSAIRSAEIRKEERRASLALLQFDQIDKALWIGDGEWGMGKHHQFPIPHFQLN
jgi:hypothetical protein